MKIRKSLKMLGGLRRRRRIFRCRPGSRRAAETGVTDTTIKIGHIQPFSGPASAYSQIAKTYEGLHQDDQRQRRRMRPSDRPDQL